VATSNPAPKGAATVKLNGKIYQGLTTGSLFPDKVKGPFVVTTIGQGFVSLGFGDASPPALQGIPTGQTVGYSP
jgi:hypothetical protein